MFSQNQIADLRNAFDIFDVDGDSKLSLEDFKKFMSSVGNKFTEEEMHDMV